METGTENTKGRTVRELFEEDILHEYGRFESMLEPFDEAAAIEYLRTKVPHYEKDDMLAERIESHGVTAMTLGMFSELCAAQGLTPFLSLVDCGGDGSETHNGTPDLRSVERGDCIGVMRAACEFLSSLASNPAIPDGTAAACGVMSCVLFDAAEAYEDGIEYGD